MVRVQFHWTTLISSLVVLASVQLAGARFPSGGWVSRDFTLVESGGYDTLFVAAMEDGEENQSSNKDVMTLWAFCTDPADPACVCTNPADCPDPACQPPCKMRTESTSLENQKYGSPAVSSDGDWILFGANDKKLHRFDTHGGHWAYERDTSHPWMDSKIPFSKGFHARPVFEKSLGANGAFVTVNRGSNNKAYLHAVDPRTGQPLWNPELAVIEGATQFLFNPILDVPCTTCAGEAACLANCCTYCGGPRVYIGADDGDKNTPAPLRAWGLSPTECGQIGQTVPCELWAANLGIGHPVRLGGEVMRNVDFEGQKAGESGDILIVNLNTGVTAVHLDDHTGNPDLWDSGSPVWNPQKTFIDQTHRSIPVSSKTERDPYHPTVYVGQRGDGECGGEGRIFRLNPATGAAANPDEDGDGDATDPALEPMFPTCNDDKIGNVSFSSPMVNPRSGHIFFGPAHAGDPIFKVNPFSPQRSNAEDELLDYARTGWFDYAPTNGWRTNATFSRDGFTVYIGSAGGIVYALDADEPCGVVRWCYDTRSGSGGHCSGHPSADPEGAQCCKDLIDTSADKPNRRMAATCESCWNDNGELIPCNETKVRDDSGQAVLDGSINFSKYQKDHPDYVTDNGDGTYEVLFILEYHVNGVHAPSQAQFWGEGMNETTGAIAHAVYCAWPCNPAEFVSLVTLKSGVANEIRFALYDLYGNESIARITVTGIQ